jgi:hypothetical protein
VHRKRGRETSRRTVLMFIRQWLIQPSRSEIYLNRSDLITQSDQEYTQDALSAYRVLTHCCCFYDLLHFFSVLNKPHIHHHGCRYSGNRSCVSGVVGRSRRTHARHVLQMATACCSCALRIMRPCSERVMRLSSLPPSPTVLLKVVALGYVMPVLFLDRLLHRLASACVISHHGTSRTLLTIFFSYLVGLCLI